MYRSATDADADAHLDGPGDLDRYERVLGELAAAIESVAVPQVVLRDGAWLVTRRPDGTPVDEPDRHPDPDDLVTAVGAGLRVLHGIDPAAVPSAEPDGGAAAAVLARCRATIGSWSADARLPPPYDRRAPGELLELLEDGWPADGEPVVCHGEPTADALLASNGTLVGIDRVDRAVVGDRHLDLAIVHLSIGDHLGPEAVFRFYEAYGDDPSIVRLDHYVLAANLLGLAPPVIDRGPAGTGL